MLYVEMFRRLANVNVYMWMIASDAYFSTKPRLHYVSSKQIALAGIWKVSETARDEHFLLISGRYLNLVPVWDTVGRIDAMLHEKKFTLSVTPLGVTPAVPAAQLPRIAEDSGELDS